MGFLKQKKTVSILYALVHAAITITISSQIKKKMLFHFSNSKYIFYQRSFICRDNVVNGVPCGIRIFIQKDWWSSFKHIEKLDEVFRGFISSLLWRPTITNRTRIWNTMLRSTPGHSLHPKWWNPESRVFFNLNTKPIMDSSCVQMADPFEWML